MTKSAAAPDSTPADIAFLRQLAEENATAPMRGAPILMAAGIVFALPSLAVWAAMKGLAPASVANWGWLVALAAFLGVLALIIPRLRGGVITASNRATGVVWSTMGWGIFAIFVSLGIISRNLDVEATRAMLSLTPSLIMVLYAIGWAVSGAMHRDRLMIGLAVASFVAAPLLALLAGRPEQYIAYAAALLLLMALPGYLLMRRAKAVDAARAA